ncbi:MAG: hypothetical protein MN733_35410 [Nitrososphaera sp.]|nr:hypothetical protein [Nitrososphaera sp.]
MYMQLSNDTSPLFQTTVTQRGQVTIPAEIRRLLGVKPRQQVGFKIKSGSVYIVPVTSTLESVYGSVSPKNSPEDFNALIRQAKDERTKRAVNSLKRA